MDISEATHEGWITLQVRQWFDQQRPDFIPATIEFIRQQNAEAGNEPGFTGEDTEYLADEMLNYAVRELAPYLRTDIVSELVRDALSEAEWLELAGELLKNASQS